MCDSTLQQVLEVLDDTRIVCEDLRGARHQVSLLAFEGDAPAVGTWLTVHSGYAIDRVTNDEAKTAIAELHRAGIVSEALMTRSGIESLEG